METQTRLSRHNKFISAENITILSVSSVTIYMLLSWTLTGYFKLYNVCVYQPLHMGRVTQGQFLSRV